MFQQTLRKAARSALAASPSTSAFALRRTSQLQTRLPAAVRPFAPRPSSRFYSTENKETSKESEASENTEAQDPVQKKLEEQEKQIIELKDKYLRSVADARNIQERAKRDQDSARNFAIQRFAKDLLESIDNFDRALLAVPVEQLNAEQTEENKALHDLVAGLKMTDHILMNTLQKHGLERFDPSELVEGAAQKFDPNLHEAVFMAPSTELKDGEVMYTQSKGFRLNGRTIRAAKVGVVKNA
ncbi:GrpE protein [Penicillium angulare]|uniref:GrpE protein n=1 Tax=Penicillium angulare TaxID=116970 RepID=UPI0025416C83|nr:GrpE protein [Penicillium angulare]KAJ5290831.1 GrpE protein [Penicillium angulare]